MCPAKASSLAHAQMASGHARVTEVTSESVPTWCQAGLELCSVAESSSSVTWLGVVLGAIGLKSNFPIIIFEKDAQEEMLGDGTGAQVHKHRSFGAQLCSVGSNPTLPPLVSGCK